MPEPPVAGRTTAGPAAPAFPEGRLRESLGQMLRALEVVGGERFMVSTLLLSPDGRRLRCHVAPSLPKAYCEAIDGGEIGLRAGSCGTAAWLGHAIFVTDIATDENWEGYRDIALAHGLRACWSTPVHGADARVIGTFAIYHREPRSPTPAEVEAVRLASLALAPLMELSR